jgi:hypothetical protein
MTKNEWTQNSSFFVEMSACRICGNESHSNQVCPELVMPLRDGFYRPQGGGGHSHEEDDDAIKKTLHPVPTDPPVLRGDIDCIPPFALGALQCAKGAIKLDLYY